MTDRRWTVKSEAALARARGLARELSHPRVTAAHLLIALFEADNFVALYLRRLGSEPDRALERATACLPGETASPTEAPPYDETTANTGSPAYVDTAPQNRPYGSYGENEPPLAPELETALAGAARWADELDDEYVSAENLLLGLAGGDDDVALTLQAAGVGRGGWQGVIRQRREVWQRQVRPRPERPGFDPTARRVLVAASRAAQAAGTAVEPAHVLVELAGLPAVAALLDALGLDAASVRRTAVGLVAQAHRVAPDVRVPVVSGALQCAIEASRAASDGTASDGTTGALALLRGLAGDQAAVGKLLSGVDEMVAVLADRVREPASRLAAAVMAQQRAMQSSDLETAARLLHGDIPALRHELEAMGPAEAALVALSIDETTPGDDESTDTTGYAAFASAVDTADTRATSRRLLRWLGDRDLPPGEPVELAAFCATVHDGTTTGREAARAAGRLALLGLVVRAEDTVSLTAAGLRCLEDRAGDPE